MYYKGYLIVLDNAKSHNNELIKNAITKSGNEYLFCDTLANDYYHILFFLLLVLIYE